MLTRIDRLANGNPRDVKAIGSGISELRIDYSSQSNDIKRAKELAEEE